MCCILEEYTIWSCKAMRIFTLLLYFFEGECTYSIIGGCDGAITAAASAYARALDGTYSGFIHAVCTASFPCTGRYVKIYEQ